MRSLVTHSSYTYSPIANFVSRRPIHYDQNSVYCKDFHSVYTVGCYSVMRKPFFRAPFPHKVDEYLYVQAPLEKACKECGRMQCCQPSILALSTKNGFNKVVGEYTCSMFADGVFELVLIFDLSYSQTLTNSSVAC